MALVLLSWMRFRVFFVGVKDNGPECFLYGSNM